MRYHCALITTLGTAGLTATASGAFTGFTTTYGGVVSGVQVYHVYANFSEADDVVVNFNNFQLVGGSMSGILHSDSTGLQGGAAWDPRNTLSSQASFDSYVMANGVVGANSVTQLSGFGSGPGIPDGAGWSRTGTLTAVGSSFRVRIAQFAGQFGNVNGFIASINVDYRDNLNAQTVRGVGSFQIGDVVPGPGALALIALAGLSRSRRR